MKQICKAILLTFSCVLAASSASALDNAAARQQEAIGQNRISLGETLDNPYSVSNMQQAFNTYNAKTTGSVFAKRPLVQATHKYIKITPSTEAHLVSLKNLDGAADGTIVLHDAPLDKEITGEGDYYVTPINESDVYYPVYTVIPVTYVMPKGLPYSVLEQLYQPTEEEYEVETLSLELKGWQNEDGCRESEVICSIKEIEEPKPAEGPQIIAEGEGGETAARLFGRRYRPHGYVMIENTDVAHSSNAAQKMEPLRQAKISIGRGIWWRYTHTDDNGYFVSPKKYRGKVRIRAKWRSNIATIRKSWNEMLGIQVSDHLMTIRRSSNGRTKNIYFGDDRLWYKGTVHNGLVKYNDYAAANGINKLISGANVWVWKNGSGQAATPMFNHHRHLASMASIAGIGQSQVWDVVINGISSFLINLVPARLRPDMLYTGLGGYTASGGYVSTSTIEQTVFHESGHYSHSKQAGSWHWAKLVASEISNSIMHGDSYHDGSEPSYTAAKQISLAEGWATFVEYKAMLATYGQADGQASWWINSQMENFDMYTVPMSLDRSTYDSWFMHGIFWDILDNNLDTSARYKSGSTGASVDNAYAGLITDTVYLPHSNTMYPVFSLLKSDVYTACDFGDDLVNANPAQGPVIETLFHSYGYTCIDGGNGLVVPGTPSGFYITNNSGGSNYLDWNGVNQATLYQIYRSSNSSSASSYYHYATVSAPTTARSVYVSSDTYFKVRACNAAGCGSFTYPRLARYSSGGPGDCDLLLPQKIQTKEEQLIADCPIER